MDESEQGKQTLSSHPHPPPKEIHRLGPMDYPKRMYLLTEGRGQGQG
jgi:hypothetical protein